MRKTIINFQTFNSIGQIWCPQLQALVELKWTGTIGGSRGLPRTTLGAPGTVDGALLKVVPQDVSVGVTMIGFAVQK